MPNKKEQKFWREVRSINPGTWFTYEGRDYLKDNSGKVFEKRGAMMIHLKDPEKTPLKRPRFHRVMTGTWDPITSDRHSRIFSESETKTGAGAIFFPATPPGKRKRGYGRDTRRKVE